MHIVYMEVSRKPKNMCGNFYACSAMLHTSYFLFSKLFWFSLLKLFTYISTAFLCRYKVLYGDVTATHGAIIVTVDHQGAPSRQIDVLVPPVSDIVGSPPRLQLQVALELLAFCLL